MIGALTDTLAHRGPDDRGVFADPKAGIALGHRRLSIAALLILRTLDTFVFEVDIQRYFRVSPPSVHQMHVTTAAQRTHSKDPRRRLKHRAPRPR